MNLSLWEIAAAGIAAGLGVALPLGAVAVLIINEGITRGRRHALAGAGAVALVDLLYCAAAVFAGERLAPLVGGWDPWPGIISGAVVIILGIRQGFASPSRAGAANPRSDHQAIERPPTATFALFFGLTAINPLTLVYFFALSSALPLDDVGAGPSLVFVLSAGMASLLWQITLAITGAVAGKSFPRAATRLFTIESVVGV